MSDGVPNLACKVHVGARLNTCVSKFNIYVFNLTYLINYFFFHFKLIIIIIIIIIIIMMMMMMMIIIIIDVVVVVFIYYSCFFLLLYIIINKILKLQMANGHKNLTRSAV